MRKHNAVVLGMLFSVAGALACGGDSPTGPVEWVTAPSEFERLSIFVRDSPDDYVQIEMTRNAGQNTFLIFRPSQPGIPRVLIDSIGPSAEDPAEVTELLYRWNIWAMADSNAAGAACSTKTGQWVCNITSNDYSLVIGVRRNGFTRAQRYTGLRSPSANGAARRLGDHVFAMARKRVVVGGTP